MKVRLFLITLCLLGATGVLCEETTKNPPKTVRITISPETTLITEPLLPDGRVDYFGAINQQLSEGVTPENNIYAGIFTLIPGEEEYAIMRAIDDGKGDQPHVQSMQTFREKYCQMLGLDTPPDLDSLQILTPPGTFEPAGVDPYKELLKFYPKEEIDAKLEARKNEEMERFHRQHKEGNLTDEQLAEKRVSLDSQQFRDQECRRMINHEFYYNAQTRIFDEKDCPLIADWMKTSTALAEKLIDVSKRPQSYNPQVRMSDDQTMYESLLPYLQTMRHIVRYFEARGNWHFGRGEYDEAFGCAFASLRLGTMMHSNTGYIVEELCGIACEGIGHYDIVNYLGHLENKKDAAWILAKQKEFRKIREGNSNRTASPIWMTGERYALLSAVAAMAANPDYIKELWGNVDDEHEQKIKFLGKCFDSEHDYDWDNVFKRINYYWEDNDYIMLLPGDMRRAKAYERLDDRLHEKARMIMGMEITPETDRENLLADFFYCSFSPAISNFFYAMLRIECTARMSEIAFSLAAYRSDQGEYPESLKALVPKYLDRIPDSPYTDKPMRYLKRAHNILLVNDETYRLDGSEEKVEKMIVEAKDVDSVFLQPRRFMLVLRY